MTAVLKPEVIEGLNICFKTANILKERFPNELMKIKSDTILAYQRKNRKCHSKGVGGYAFYSNANPPRIIIMQKCLVDRDMLRTKIKNRFDRVRLHGNFALIELMCHELAHHRTKGHAKGFKIKYLKFLQYMTNKVLSGDWYRGGESA